MEHLQMENDDGGPLIEKVAETQLRAPPPEPPGGWDVVVKPGALLELAHMDGCGRDRNLLMISARWTHGGGRSSINRFWEVEVIKPTKNGLKWQVRQDSHHSAGLP